MRKAQQKTHREVGEKAIGAGHEAFGDENAEITVDKWHRRVRYCRIRTLRTGFVVLCHLFFSQDNGRTSGDVELQPTLPVTLKYGVVVREMSDGVVIEALAAESLGIGVEHHAVCSLFHHETIIYVRCGGREVENEKQISSLVRQKSGRHRCAKSRLRAISGTVSHF